jgi:hypothetical protein
MKKVWLSLFVTLSLAELTSPAHAKRADGAQTPGSAREATARAAGSAKESAPTGSKAGSGALAKTTKAKPCYARPLQLARVRGEQVEPRELSVTLCSGAPNLAALDELSILARPRDVARPSPAEVRAYRARPVAKGKIAKKDRKKYRNPAYVTDHIMRLHKGLLVRLQKIAKRYPGKIIEVVSGYRPDARVTSRHHHGRALDLRVAGVTRERLISFVRGFDDTGVGYYPNSYFVHVDVREEKAFWVDRSGPGEAPDYGPWPVKKQPLDREREQVVKGALAALAALDQPVFRDEQRTAHLTRTLERSPVRQPEQEPDDMSLADVKRVRAEAKRALDQL